MPGQALHVFKRHALLQRVGDGSDAKRVRRIQQRQPDISEPALHHAANVINMNSAARELALLLEGAMKERRVLRRIAQAGDVDIGLDQLLQVVPHRDFA